MTREEFLKMIDKANDREDAEGAASATKELGDYYDSNRKVFDDKQSQIDFLTSKNQKLAMVFTDGVIDSTKQKTEEQLDKEAAESVFDSISEHIKGDK